MPLIAIYSINECVLEIVYELNLKLPCEQLNYSYAGQYDLVGT